ncbi:MAG: solute:sodium symporter family transporter [Planctomycetes bacterium]|nr:solute:sodium symporter family transporter [Planctomycetota bacterium]
MLIASFLFFTGLVAALTWWLTHKDDHGSSTGYFLAGRRLGGVVIAGSLLLTNLSTEQLVGLNGDAYKDGLCVMAWEVVSVLALVAMALFFLPRFLKSGIATVPQFLEERFDRGTRDITTVIFLIAYTAILLPIILYTGARGLNGMMDMQKLTGIASETTVVWLTVWIVGIIGSIYALFGGLRTVAVSDTLNGVGLLIGGFMITYYGLAAVGSGAGAIEGYHMLRTAEAARFNSIGGPGQTIPFWTLFSGATLLMFFYWTTNQQIIQRAFAARNLKEGQKGVLLCGALKLLGPMYLVLPGMIAYHLYKGDATFEPVKAYGRLVRDVLPVPLTGFFVAVVVGAILSSYNSALNSATTLFSLGIYKPMFKPDASDHQVVQSGKWFGWIVAVLSMLGAPLLMQTESIFSYLQKMNGLYFIPIFAVVLVGMLCPRVPAIAAKLGLVLGCVIIAAGYFVPPLAEKLKVINGFHFLGLVFVFVIVMMLAIGAIAPRAERWRQNYSGDVDLTPWGGAKPVGVVLVLIVMAIYAWYADFSMLSGS